jgi:hypothetical protein
MGKFSGRTFRVHDNCEFRTGVIKDWKERPILLDFYAHGFKVQMSPDVAKLVIRGLKWTIFRNRYKRSNAFKYFFCQQGKRRKGGEKR